MNQLEKILLVYLCSLFFLIHPVESKSCSDSFEAYLASQCSSIYISSTQKCNYFQGKCTLSYRDCSYYTGKNSTICESIIPSNPLDKCQIQGNRCTSVTKKCNDYSSVKDIYCEYFSASDATNMKCISTEEGCREVYRTCDLYNSLATNKKKEDCESITLSDSSKKCVFSEGVCSTKAKECSDFTNSNACNSYIPQNSEKKKCNFIDDKCVEQYKTCEIYNQETNKTPQECQKIIPYHQNYDYLDNYSKCVFDDGQCLRKKKECNEITNSNTCNNHVLENQNKRCIYENNQCKEIYGSCSNYNKESDIKEEICNNIIIYNSNGYIYYNYKCVFESGSCNQKSKTCDDYKSGQDEMFCTGISLNSYSKCVLENNICKAKYIDCPNDYTTSISLDRSTCEAIIPNGEYYMCKLNSNSKCVRQKKICSEYKGDSSYNCQNYEASDSKKKCFMENDKCVEKYYQCADYEGKDTNTCESIIPYDSYGSSQLSGVKCKMVDNTCTQVSKECSDFNESEYQCYQLTPTDNNKRCVYKDKKCIEQYKDCETYNNNVGTIDKSICESIIPYSPSSKCVFTSGNQCEEKNKECKDTTDEYECTDTYYVSPSDPTNKKCVYKNNKCIEQYKDCDTYNNHGGAIEQSICESIELNYDQYKCVFTSGDSGNRCEQKQKECKDTTDSYKCTSTYYVIPSDPTNKKCVYKENKCIEVYKDCAAYNNYGGTIDKTICESIDLNSDYYKCVFTAGSTKNTCEQKNKECKDATTYDECYNYVSSSDPTNKKCAYKDNKCIEQYKDCEAYNNNGGVVEKSVCESIDDKSYKCVFTSGNPNKCERKKKACNEITDYSACLNSQPIDSNKKCKYIREECVEQYKDCETYNNNGGTIEKTVCESIKLDEDADKCVFTSGNKCEKKRKECKEAKESYECSSYYVLPSDTTNKKCVYKNNECIEQYKDCDAYNNNGGVVEKTVCESIELNSNSYKCAFTAGETKNTCEQKSKGCEDFNIESYKDSCGNYSPNEIGKKCAYANMECSEVNQSCLELENNSGVTEDICKAASVSSGNKKCQIKGDNTGCEEVGQPKSGGNWLFDKITMVCVLVGLLI